MTDRNDLDDPVKKAQIVGLLLKLSPLAFGLCYFLAWIQGAEPRFCLLIAAVGAGMCLVRRALSSCWDRNPGLRLWR